MVVIDSLVVLVFLVLVTTGEVFSGQWGILLLSFSLKLHCNLFSNEVFLKSPSIHQSYCHDFKYVTAVQL